MNEQRGFQVDHGPASIRIHEGVSRAAYEAADQLSELGWFGMSLEPGDATHYEVFGVRNGLDRFRIGFMAGTDRGRSSVVARDVYLHWSYVQDTFELRNTHSAMVLADFLNVLFGHIEGA